MHDQMLLACLRHATGIDLEDLTTFLAATYPEAAWKGIQNLNARVTPRLLLYDIVNAYRAWRVSVQDIIGRSRNDDVVYVRCAAMAILQEALNLSQDAIGKVFDNREHATVGYALRMADRTTPNYRDALDAVRARLEKSHDEQNARAVAE